MSYLIYAEFHLLMNHLVIYPREGNFVDGGDNLMYNRTTDRYYLCIVLKNYRKNRFQAHELIATLITDLKTCVQANLSVLFRHCYVWGKSL